MIAQTPQTQNILIPRALLFLTLIEFPLLSSISHSAPERESEGAEDAILLQLRPSLRHPPHEPHTLARPSDRDSTQ